MHKANSEDIQRKEKKKEGTKSKNGKVEIF